MRQTSVWRFFFWKFFMLKQFRYIPVLFATLLCAPIVLADQSEQLNRDQNVLESSSIDVSVEDIERYIIENLPPDATQRQGVLNRPGVYREMAENLYLIRTLAAEAEQQLGFDKEQARWAANMAYQRRLMERYRTVFLQNSLAEVDWDAVALEHYRANPERYQRPEVISAAHILLKPEGRTKEEAEALAKSLYERVKAGEDFGELAKEYSDDGSAASGGELGFFQRGKMVPPFEEAAFALQQPGDVSEPVESAFGYHIIVLRDRKPAGLVPFAEVKDRIAESLQREMGNQLWQDKLVQLRSAKSIALDEAALAALRDKYAITVDDAKTK
tara:strand:+ start:1455 stop:2441 length:987 start_codon:yes stop_codon:yes gene_type:complete